MPQNKVVSIESLRPAKPARLAPADRSPAGRVSKNRFIVQIGSQRLAFDLTTEITELDPGFGGDPAPLLSTDPKSNSRRAKATRKPPKRKP
jgi:hypothetical protein